MMMMIKYNKAFLLLLMVAGAPLSAAEKDARALATEKVIDEDAALDRNPMEALLPPSSPPRSARQRFLEEFGGNKNRVDASASLPSPTVPRAPRSGGFIAHFGPIHTDSPQPAQPKDAEDKEDPDAEIALVVLNDRGGRKLRVASSQTVDALKKRIDALEISVGDLYYEAELVFNDSFNRDKKELNRKRNKLAQSHDKKAVWYSLLTAAGFVLPLVPLYCKVIRGDFGRDIDYAIAFKIWGTTAACAVLGGVIGGTIFKNEKEKARRYHSFVVSDDRVSQYRNCTVSAKKFIQDKVGLLPKQ